MTASPSASPPDPQLVTLTQLLARVSLPVTRRTVYRWLRSGLLGGSRRINGRVYFRVDEVEDCLRRLGR